MFDYDFRLDFSDSTFEIVRAAGFASIDEAQASLNLAADVEFVSLIGTINRAPQAFLAW